MELITPQTLVRAQTLSGSTNLSSIPVTKTVLPPKLEGCAPSPLLTLASKTLSAVNVLMVVLTRGIAELARPTSVHRVLNGSFGTDT